MALMATEVESLEDQLPDMANVLSCAAIDFMRYYSLAGMRTLTAADVDEIDLIYCRVEVAADLMRAALCLRQRGQRLREAPELALEGMD